MEEELGAWLPVPPPPHVASKKLEGHGWVGRAWEGARDEWGRQSLGRGRGRGQSQATPTAPDRTRNSSSAEAGETEKERHTYRDRELHTARKRRGRTHLDMEPSTYTRGAGVSDAVHQAPLCSLL